MGWGWRHYLILLAFNGVLIGLAMGLHYGHMHHSPAEEVVAPTEEVVAPAEIVPWPAHLKGQMINACVSTVTSREQCTCTFDWWEQHASLKDYLAWSAAVATGRPISDEAAQTFARSGAECISTEEPAASEGSSEAAQWPDDIREGFIESCAAQTPASLEQCRCTFEWWEQNVSLAGYLDISNAMMAGRPLSDEQAQLLARSGAHCTR